jgi:hypothetical protein
VLALKNSKRVESTILRWNYPLVRVKNLNRVSISTGRVLQVPMEEKAEEAADVTRYEEDYFSHWDILLNFARS